MSYTNYGPFTDGSSPGISASFLDALETFLDTINSAATDSNISSDGSGNVTAASYATSHGVGGMIYFITPYHMFTNPTLNSGTTRTDTYTGGSTGVPSGAKAVILGIGIFASTANGYLQIYQTGGTAGQGPGITGVGTAYTIGSCVCPVNSSGQITLKANGSNIVLQDWYIYGYII